MNKFEMVALGHFLKKRPGGKSYDAIIALLEKEEGLKQELRKTEIREIYRDLSTEALIDAIDELHEVLEHFFVEKTNEED